MKRVLSQQDFWAKLKRDDDNEIASWHSLLAHSADVAAVTQAVLTQTILRERLARLGEIDRLTDGQIARLCVLAAIHDAGKVNHGFQDQAFDARTPKVGHVRPIVDLLESESLLNWLGPLGIPDMLAWFDDDAEMLQSFLLLTWGHHGRPVLPQVPRSLEHWHPNDRRDPVEGLTELADHVRGWYPQAFDEDTAPLPSTPAFQHAFNGVLTLADWIGSDARYFPFVEGSGDPMPAARRRAADAVKVLYLDPDETRSQLGDDFPGFSPILGMDAEPYPIQKECSDLPIHEAGSLTILESDTGSGKTEAAVARFIRLYQAGLVDGMYFAVPTRSAATQLQARVSDVVSRVFPKDARPPVILAVPGYVKADDEEGIRLPNFQVEWPEDVGGVKADRGWAASHAKRYLAGAIVVGTVDQVLMSTLQINHAHMRAAALLRHFLVVDEVHASDVYMTALMDRVLEQHLAAGGHALLMSATLASSARVHLATAGRSDPPDLPEAEKLPYPLLTHVDALRREPKPVPAASSGINKRVQPDVLPLAAGHEEVARLAIEHAKAGARVLIIRNTVKDCLATQLALEAITNGREHLHFRVAGIVAPHHSRFAPDDRKHLDAAIEATFGKKTKASGVIAVATQTVEQSLDIDADILITDLCPMDVLLQRIGRLHRHDRGRPTGYEIARCIVLTPAERDLSCLIRPDGKAGGPNGIGTVYHDLRVLEATWRVLEDGSLGDWCIPRHNRLLVERSTHPDRLREIVEGGDEAWHRHEQWVLAKDFAEKLHPTYVCVAREKPFSEAGFIKDLGDVKTRLGAQDYRVELPEPAAGPFGSPISELNLSHWMIDGDPPDEMVADEVQASDGGFDFQFAGKRFVYNRLGVRALAPEQ